jgi:hypothetical protein
MYFKVRGSQAEMTVFCQFITGTVSMVPHNFTPVPKSFRYSYIFQFGNLKIDSICTLPRPSKCCYKFISVIKMYRTLSDPVYYCKKLPQMYKIVYFFTKNYLSNK